ncbi:serine/threonine protein kinase [Dysgonomonadaceae bacterium PH5-43]|nr:serine/threonine protein kinase [Dysgonomonadaceae bacterium PH5-43]
MDKESSSFDDIYREDPFSFSEIIPLNNSGSTSETFKVQILGKWHFLKRPKKEFIDHPRYQAAFNKEFDLGYSLYHPNIVRYISKGKDNDGSYILTEYIDGRTLDEFIKENPTYFRLKRNRFRFYEQLLSAIAYLHTHQILHLDLKPENILITHIGNDVKLIDLGFSYSDCYQFLTSGKTVIYAAPEQIEKSNIDTRTDIFGIGRLIETIPYLSSLEKQCVKRCLQIDKCKRYDRVESLQTHLLEHKRESTKIILSILSLLLIAGTAIALNVFFRDDTNNIEKVETKKEVVTNDSIETEISKDIVRDTIRIIETPTIVPSVINKETTSSNIQKKESPIVNRYDEAITTFEDALKQTYTLRAEQSYSLETRYKKWKYIQNKRVELLKGIEDGEQKDKLEKQFYYNENIWAAPYIQQSVIKELESIMNTNLSAEPTPEYILAQFNKTIAPYYLPFYKKYVLIDNYATYIQAKKELDDIKQITEPILHTVYNNNKDVYSSREVFYEQFMARLPHYPYFNYIYPAEDLLQNYVLNYLD